ncbi:short-chain dehydrogenase [Sorangium cellulosum]|uniref:Short-chain dehydrogenase n=1 Tax=Sorangium cellulosum TaxID=56 RepID=A0A2L0F8V3_SORCE|nr:glucose 1-dehydrogenase [Sorangium cellulosum]AUX47990.1 short-chain dehydrogenase [Sorangium cellulosum]
MAEAGSRRFEGRTAIVTGAGTGVGRATALALAREGARVIVANRRADAGESAVAAIEALGGEAFYVQTDVARRESVQGLVEAALARYDRIDILINNAGVLGPMAPTADVTEEQWDEVMDINLKGAWLCMKYAIPAMVRQRRGVIINVASSANLRTYPYLSAYSASKAGMLGMTRVAAAEYAKAGILVKALCLGAVRTPMIEPGIKHAGNEALLDSMHAVGRIAEPEEVGEAIVWLCSDQASFVVGPALNMTGGTELL